MILVLVRSAGGLTGAAVLALTLLSAKPAAAATQGGSSVASELVWIEISQPE
ncbi:hypothetical protein QSU92_07395 [Microbacterium sp. ET2]|uniref:hypothetical protein n=1 Tax=Microbacterium albipurpureum TaxID=3050384 RepID=UPI00259D142D|nr:hypothetical protein [Microbacterium sp. ET2 (Ac-2212)]WJL96981.1 hypothetical protein QSU92_07395 [Microbacterium sp. ET2 (Ac-2212)]